ncbi:hybrid sensor histidine kinase/response regulator [Nodosilinea sp. LEGE 06152]|uniref:hybrid sensor histidine kinase/response regulator n=1 Tax=Nodosilinea sp. LEGE 06152 TaxID=2777966 RepID=UPI001D141F60|nr:hybrid sensor histidine kinase/response regulator [Nodosilinea sp. LEGE 06152]
MARNSDAALDYVLNPAAVRVLLIEDDLAEARFLQEVLKGAPRSRFQLRHAKRLAEAIAWLGQDDFDVALLDLTLPDSSGLDSLDVLLQQAPGLPVVVLTNTNDDTLAVAAVRHGAQDYLMKRSLQQEVLVRSLFYAIERQRAEDALRDANEILEDRVQARTAELEAANRHLRQEIEQRQRIQERLTLAQNAASIGTFEWCVDALAPPSSSDPVASPWPIADMMASFSANWPWPIHPDDTERVSQELRRATQQGQGLKTEFRILVGDRVHWLTINSSLICDVETHSERLLGIHMDITDKKQLEAQFLRSQRLEGLGTLASGIAHDLNNILTPILLVVQLLPLKLKAIDPWVQSKLDILEASTQRGADLVKQILAFTRGVEGKRFALQVNHLLVDIRKLVQQTLPKSIDVYTHVPDGLWPVWGDPTQLHQVFMNLCVNARDAMPTGGTLRITAENLTLDHDSAQRHFQAQPGFYVKVTIADTGTGMEPAVLNQIFDPFFTTKALGQGTGLGLSAVLGIVESHGGFIDVQSQVGQGSQFQVYLRASFEPSPEVDIPVTTLDGHQSTVLVVDDEPAVYEAVRTVLELHNYRVMVAHGGQAAIALLSEHPDTIHTVLMDLMMPTMDGLTTVPLLKRINPDLRVIAMSGLSSTDAVAKAEQQGFQSFLPKPFTRQDLLQQIRPSGSP